MGVKVYISGISGNKEVKKRQQRVLMILESRNIEYSVVDITEPGREPDRDYMQEKSTSLGATVSDTNPRHPLPPQLFNDEKYCGDYDEFDMANEIDELDKFLKLAASDDTKISNAEITLGNGTIEPEPEPEIVDSSEAVVDSSEPVADSSEPVADSSDLSEKVDETNKPEPEPDEEVATSDQQEAESSEVPDENADDNDEA